MKKTICLILSLALQFSARGIDLSGGILRAVPVPEGVAISVDGDVSEWDLSGAEDVWMASETADRFRARLAVMYDEKALYVAAKVRLPDRSLHNPNSPIEPFWRGDCLQFRMIADPAIPHNADAARLKENSRVISLSMWKDTGTGQDHLHVVSGVKFDQGVLVDPPEAVVAIIPKDGGYIMESRIPWAALNVPDGVNPFKPGERMTFVAEVLWDHTTLRVAAIYDKNPGVFAFKNPQEWGQLEFCPAGALPARHPDIDTFLSIERGRNAPGVPIELTLEKPSKVSLNLFDASGGVIRELTGGELRPAGKSTWYWDGRDQWGNPLAPGTYRWGAYLSPGLKAQYVGSVGSSGNPPYPSADGKGGWGGEHGDPVDVAADSTGLYFLWMIAEEGCAVVKTDFGGNVIWRTTPFVGGGFGPFFHLTTNGKYVFFIFGRVRSALGRLDAQTGRLVSWPGRPLIEIASNGTAVSETNGAPFVPAAVGGLVANDHEVFTSVPGENTIRAFDVDSGAMRRELAAMAPLGLALDGQGDLFAVSAMAGGPFRVVRFAKAQGKEQPVVEEGLVSPWDVAVDEKGLIHVTDGGASQQVKVFSREGKLLRALGREGGRPWAGKYDVSSFLNPSGIAADPHGGILVAESSLPKPISRLSAADGGLLQRWFGGTSYAPTNVPDTEDPRTNYYSLSSDPHVSAGGGFARARIPDAGGVGLPDAYWNLPAFGTPGAGLLLDTMNVPELLVADNGRKYLVSDSSSVRQCHGIAEIQGNSFLPVAHARVLDPTKSGTGLEFWSDANGDHQVQENELRILNMVEGKPIAALANTTGSMWMASNGDLFFATHANRILKVPSTGFDPPGVPQWDLTHAAYAVPSVISSLGDKLSVSYREGILGMRVDKQGNLYTCLNTNAPYATPQLTLSKREGIGHSSRFNTVKFAKFDPTGKLLWMAGRKATAAAKPGEMYHFWVLAGMVGDLYVAGASEWGQIYFYTHDGFFVDALMNDPALGGNAGPYTFGGETFAGRVQYFPKLDEVWAYSCARAFKVEGFEKGRVKGERRLSGTVVLDKVHTDSEKPKERQPLVIVPLSGDAGSPQAWGTIPAVEIDRFGKSLATLQVGYDDVNVYARFQVAHAAPFRNGSDSSDLVFKGGDCVGLSFGPAGKRAASILGDVRLLASRIQGRSVLIAFKPLSKLGNRAQRYYTPAAGEALFEDVGEVPGGSAIFSDNKDGSGYTALLSIPRAFLECDFSPGGTLAGEAEVLLSGQGARGLQVMSRNYLFSPASSETSMVDDVATESRLYPRHWGTILIK